MTYKKYTVNLNILKLRWALNLSQEEFSKRLNIKRAKLGAIEEKRAGIRLEMIFELIRLNYLSKEHVFDFMYNENFKPEPGVKFKKKVVQIQ